MIATRELADWLAWQETLHPDPIDLGLERVRRVFRAMHPDSPPFRVITVAGTNGKGSCVAMLEAILSRAGYRVGTYTSPHLLRYNERIRIAGSEADDAALCESFARIDAARAGITLTYFEFGTLAALDLFWGASLDVAVLEVGMGGRLDAVNVLDADAALITSVGLDHTAWLGTDREAIAREKAGILRSGRPAVFGQRALPKTLAAEAEALGARLYVLGRDFAGDWGAENESVARSWAWRGPDSLRPSLPAPALHGCVQIDNAASVLMVLASLAEVLPVTQLAVREGLLGVQLPGRFQVLPGPITRIFDVAHNPDSVRVLAHTLARHGRARTLAVLGMMADKDIEGCIGPLAGQVDAWHLAGLETPRAAAPEDLARALETVAPGAPRQLHAQVAEAYRAACAAAQPGDRVLVFGSFHTVAAALAEAL